MSAPDRGRGNVPTKQKELSSTAPADATEPYPDWVDRMQRARGRHAAITRNLNTWSSYKNWADRMRESFDDEERPPQAGATAANGGKGR